MKQHGKKGIAGSTLVEVIVAITILGLVCAPICSSLVLASRVNARAEQMMAAQLRVGSAVERLMAEGVSKTTDDGQYVVSPKFEGITVEVTETAPLYYGVKIYDGEEEDKAIAVVNTTVRATPAEGGDGA